MISYLRSFMLCCAVYAGIASLYLPSPGGCRAPHRGPLPRSLPPAHAPGEPAVAPQRLLATSCKSDSDCNANESCVDGTCCMPANKAWEGPPHSALATWGDSLRISR
mgnify:FL=1